MRKATTPAGHRGSGSPSAHSGPYPIVSAVLPTTSELLQKYQSVTGGKGVCLFPSQPLACGAVSCGVFCDRTKGNAERSMDR